MAITVTSAGPKGRAALGQCPKLGPQQLVLHRQLADALHGRGELTIRRIALTLLQRPFEGGLGPLLPLLELEQRQAELAGEQLGRLAAHQPQHHLALARRTPALTRRQWALRCPTFRSWGGLTCGQRGWAAPALADYRPIHSVISIGLVHAALHHIGLRLDKSVSRETGCSSSAAALVEPHPPLAAAEPVVALGRYSPAAPSRRRRLGHTVHSKSCPADLEAYQPHPGPPKRTVLLRVGVQWTCRERLSRSAYPE